MLKNFKLRIEYDGTDCHGWQRQAGRRTIQGDIETALRTMTGRPVTVIGSGRTDAGVHALGQIAHFRCDTHLAAPVFLKGLNSLLGQDIVIREAEEADADFHARFDATGKIYHYRILNDPMPSAIHRRYAWHISAPLHDDAMTEAARFLAGTHDFKAFEGAGSPRPHTVRRVGMADFIRDPHGFLTFRIQADGFLRYMVRNIVGTLVEIGRGKRMPEDLKTILASCDRKQAAPTAPPHGLFLIRVQYGPEEMETTRLI